MHSSLTIVAGFTFCNLLSRYCAKCSAVIFNTEKLTNFSRLNASRVIFSLKYPLFFNEISLIYRSTSALRVLSLLQKFNMGENSAKTEKKTTFAVEPHTTYDKEVKVGDEVDLNILFLDHDKKRLVYKLEMLHKEEQYLAATTEVCSLYVDLNVRKVVEFELEKSNLIDKFINENKKDFNSGELHLIKKLKK